MFMFHSSTLSSSSTFSTTIVRLVTSAAMASRVGKKSAPTTPNVRGISIRVFPSLLLIVTRRMFPCRTSFLIVETSFSPLIVNSSLRTSSSSMLRLPSELILICSMPIRQEGGCEPFPGICPGSGYEPLTPQFRLDISHDVTSYVKPENLK